MFEAYTSTEVASKLEKSVDISFLTAHHHSARVYVGSKAGHLLSLTESKQGKRVYDLVMCRSFEKKTVHELQVVARHGILLCLSDSQVSAHDTTVPFAFKAAISDIKPVTAFCSHVTKDDGLLYVAVAARKKILLYKWLLDEFTKVPLELTPVVLSCSALECLEKLLVTGKESIKKEVCWTLSNILAGNRKQIQTVIDAHILPSLIHVLASGDFKTRKEACWAIGNALSGGNASQVAAVVREGAILPLCDLLTVMEPKIVSVVLNALDSILRHGENIRSKSKTGINPYCALVEEARGPEKLEFLQQSPNLEIYVKAFDIIENYFFCR